VQREHLVRSLRGLAATYDAASDPADVPLGHTKAGGQFHLGHSNAELDFASLRISQLGGAAPLSEVTIKSGVAAAAPSLVVIGIERVTLAALGLGQLVRIQPVV
jgi:hypothetical protein